MKEGSQTESEVCPRQRFQCGSGPTAAAVPSPTLPWTDIPMFDGLHQRGAANDSGRSPREAFLTDVLLIRPSSFPRSVLSPIHHSHIVSTTRLFFLKITWYRFISFIYHDIVRQRAAGDRALDLGFVIQEFLVLVNRRTDHSVKVKEGCQKTQ